jgi:hypothetical protein
MIGLVTDVVAGQAEGQMVPYGGLRRVDSLDLAFWTASIVRYDVSRRSPLQAVTNRSRIAPLSVTLIGVFSIKQK